MSDPDSPILVPDARVLEMRKSGSSWADIERALGLNRQQARYAYQKAKRIERRKLRRGQD